VSHILQEPWDAGMSVQFRIDEVYARRRTPYQELLVAQTETYGRCLFIDELVQSTEADEALYHEPFVHPALVIHGAPRHVLVGGAGEGATLREILRHPTVEQVVAVDLDPEVIEVCREHLPAWSDGAFDDPRVTVRIEDVLQTLAEPPQARGQAPWDVILMDVTDPVEAGPAVDVFTVEFFLRAAAALHDDGIFVLQSGELDPHDLRLIRTVHSTLAAAFSWVHVIPIHVPSFHCIWSVTLAAKRPPVAVPNDLEARVARLPGARLRAYSAAMHRVLLTQPPWLSRGLGEPVRVLRGEGLVTYRRGAGP
jgi:spermidine synthase